MAEFPDPKRIGLPPRPGAGEGAGIALSLHDAGSGPAVVLCHGFPELGYSWRHQFPALTEAGFRAVAPDQRGYGASDRPEAIEAYDLLHLTGDLVGLLDALELDRAVFAGHDWGGFVAWAMPVLHPERTLGVIGVNTPYMAFPPTQMMRMLTGGEDERLYILWFQQPGVAEGVLDAKPRLVFERLMRGGVDPAQAAQEMLRNGKLDANPFRRLEELEPLGEPIVSEADLDHYAGVFAETGFRGGINWYRNIDRNRERAPGVGTEKIEHPCLMVTAEWDPALRPELAAGMPNLCPDLEMHKIEKCGHWTQQEKPDALNALMVDWLRRRFL